MTADSEVRDPIEPLRLSTVIQMRFTAESALRQGTAGRACGHGKRSLIVFDEGDGCGK